MKMWTSICLLSAPHPSLNLVIHLDALRMQVPYTALPFCSLTCPFTFLMSNPKTSAGLELFSGFEACLTPSSSWTHFPSIKNVFLCFFMLHFHNHSLHLSVCLSLFSWKLSLSPGGYTRSHCHSLAQHFVFPFKAHHNSTTFAFGQWPVSSTEE